jgi:hypothetical protein
MEAGETVIDVSVVGAAVLPPHPTLDKASNESATSAFGSVSVFLKFIEWLLCVSVLALLPGPSVERDAPRDASNGFCGNNGQFVRCVCTRHMHEEDQSASPRAVKALVAQTRRCRDANVAT